MRVRPGRRPGSGLRQQPISGRFTGVAIGPSWLFGILQRGQGELDLNLSRRNGKRHSGRNQATGRKLASFLQQVVVPTPAVLAQYQRLDDALDDATARIMGLDLLRLPGTPAARGLADPVVVAQRARLPARLRGTGHRRMVDVALAAFIGSMAMVIPRMPDRTDDNRDTIVGLFSHLVAVTGTGEDFQRKYEGSRRFSTFFRQADAIGIEMGTGLREAWETVRREVGDPAIGIFSVGAEDLPGPAERRPLSRVWI